ncbi:hypothetical protein GON05_32970 [Paenibacillus sp. MAH-34]|uniref:DUF6385 domain-containing protein n=1 Tax=Paenibacillus anseongense TaxID=2682845 RepID=A0ABW9ULM6_9BACL|nr:DUF6385 domain-containing protein [Paenibacillus anseongense]MVQ39415.1 hypothetical protein [Paenibacillus anseongense]
MKEVLTISHKKITIKKSVKKQSSKKSTCAKKKCFFIVCSKKRSSPVRKKCPSHQKRKKIGLPCDQPNKIITLHQPVQVSSNQLDIRNLIPESDKVQIFGNDGNEVRAVRTDHNGRLEVVILPTNNTLFIEESFLNLKVTNHTLTLPVQDTSTITMNSYAVINRGDVPAIVCAEISPNSVDFIKDCEDIVPPKSMKVFVLNRFLKWTRLILATDITCGKGSTECDVYFQAQTTIN